MILQIGDSGSYVALLQRALGIRSDGVFGAQTKSAVEDFQRSHGLNPDGVVGPMTIAALRGNDQSVEPTHPGDPAPLPSGNGPILGVDVYHLDNVTSWAKVYGSRRVFAFIKATQGVSYRDTKYVQYMEGAQNAGLITGPYHFMTWASGSGAAQARYFKAQIDSAGGLQANNLPPACDWEYSPERDPVGSDLQVGKDFLEEIAQLTGRRPVLYVSSSVPGELHTPSWMANYYLWDASYRSSPKIPGPWSKWTFWQNSGSGSVPGIGNEADTDFFNGSIEDLKKL